MNDVRASRRRVAKFAIPTLMCCILINIPKFFESKIEYYQDEYGNEIGKKNIFCYIMHLWKYVKVFNYFLVASKDAQFFTNF